MANTAPKPKKVIIQFAVALVIAVIIGIAAIVMCFTLISSVSGSANKKAAAAQAEADDLKAKLAAAQSQPVAPVVPQTFKVVQATSDVQPGQPITRNMVTLVDTNDRPSPGALSLLSQAVGKMSRSQLIAGEAIDASQLIDSGYLNVQAGMRAISVSVDNIGALNGSLTPGAHVDVLTNLTQNDKVTSRTILQNVQVIAVGDNALEASASSSRGTGTQSLSSMTPQRSSSSNGAGAVTLVVSPKQAEMLTLAGQIGAFHLTLRNFHDSQRTHSSGTDIAELLTGIDKNVMRRKLPPQSNPALYNVNFAPDGNLPAPGGNALTKSKFTMQVYRGTGMEPVQFQQ